MSRANNDERSRESHDVLVVRASLEAEKAARRFKKRHGRVPTREELRRELVQTTSPLLRAFVALLGAACAALGGSLALWAGGWSGLGFGLAFLGGGGWLVVLAVIGQKKTLEETACAFGDGALEWIFEAVFQAIF